MFELTTKAVFSAASLLGHRLPIVMFHRVLGAPDPLSPFEIDAETFRERIGWLKATFDILCLRDAVELMRQARLPQRALCITFDDGYADNCDRALPILHEMDVQATFFVTTRYLDGGMMWNDRIIEALRVWPGESMDCTAYGLGNYDFGEGRARTAALMLERMKYLDFDSRERISSDLLDASESPVSGLMMNATQIRALHEAGMEIGGHTHSHPILQRIPPEEAYREIARNKEILEGIVGSPVTSFAYPNGKPRLDFDERHIPMLLMAGYSVAVTTSAGAARDLAKPFELPRFSPWDRKRSKYFARLLVNYFREPDFVGPTGSSAA